MIEWNGRSSASACLYEAHNAERLGRLQHHVADDHTPREPLGADARKSRPLEFELNDLSLTRARHRSCG